MYCPSCGNNNPETPAFCAFCGQRLRGAAPGPQATPPPGAGIPTPGQGMPGAPNGESPQGLPGGYASYGPPQGMPGGTPNYGPPQGMPGGAPHYGPPQGMPGGAPNYGPPQGMPGGAPNYGPPQGTPPGYPAPGAYVPPPGAGFHPPGPAKVIEVPNYMTQSILVTLCCCLPLGIAAIVQSSKVNPLLKAGDYQGALKASEEANKYGKWSVFGGLLAILLNLGLQFLAASLNSHH